MYVYKITNQINKKIYIGITTNSIQHRWFQHCYAAEHSLDNYLLHKAMRKYGIDNFTIEQINECDNIDTLKTYEQYYIKQYHSCIYDEECNGYNMTWGGDGCDSLIGEQHPASIISDDIRWQIIDLLCNSTLTFQEIADRVNLQQWGLKGISIINMINRGKNFYQPDLIYPLRSNNRSIAKKGEHNPSAKIDAVKEVIKLLSTTNLTQQEIADKCGVHYNTVSNINQCKYWTELHSYQHNIREESGTTVRSVINKKNEDKIKCIIKDIEDGYTNQEIAERCQCGIVLVSQVNTCKKYTYLHQYKNNIRKESRGDV